MVAADRIEGGARVHQRLLDGHEVGPLVGAGPVADEVPAVEQRPAGAALQDGGGDRLVGELRVAREAPAGVTVEHQAAALEVRVGDQVEAQHVRAGHRFAEPADPGVDGQPEGARLDGLGEVVGVPREACGGVELRHQLHVHLDQVPGHIVHDRREHASGRDVESVDDLLSAHVDGGAAGVAVEERLRRLDGRACVHPREGVDHQRVRAGARPHGLRPAGLDVTDRGGTAVAVDRGVCCGTGRAGAVIGLHGLVGVTPGLGLAVGARRRWVVADRRRAGRGGVAAGCEHHRGDDDKPECVHARASRWGEA